MKTTFFKIISTVLFALSLLASCEREEEQQQGTDQEEEQIIESASTFDEESEDVLEITASAEAQLVSTGGRVNNETCAVITHDELNKKIIIDFGDGCVGPHGRERKGKIIITYSSELGDNVANRIITFEDYFVNNKGVTGAIELRDVSINADGNWQCTKRLVELTISFPNGDQAVFNGTRTRELIAGGGDDDCSNNVYRITGSVNGRWTNGRTFTHEIVEPIISDWSCAAEGNFARVAGVVEVTRLGGYKERKRTVDYGDGECDNVITITTFRRTYSLTILN